MSLPAHVQESLKMGQRTVEVRLAAESPRIGTATLGRAAVEVQIDTKP